MIRNLQVWAFFAVLVGLAFVAMFFVSRSNIVIERSRSAAETLAVRSRLDARLGQQKARAIRQIDQALARLISIEAQRPAEAFFGSPEDSAEGNDEQIQPWGRWQDNSYAKAFFAWPASGPPRTVWSFNGESVEDILPQLEQSNWNQWFFTWQNAQVTGWVASPSDIYRINERIYQLQLRDAGDLANRTRAPKDKQSQSNQETTNTNSPGTPTNTESAVGPIYPIWCDGELCLVRQVRSANEISLIGCVLNWQRLRVDLIRDLKGEFEGTPALAAVYENYPNTDNSDYSVWFPAKIELIQREAQVVPYPSDGGWVLLGLGWAFLAITCGAIGLLLHTVLRMSNRREAFVSSVTHELRTPLTTFRLYADLLAKAPDPEKTRTYAKTLQTEAERLSHLVENVLCYSRMEKRGITSHHRVSPVGEMLDAMVPRLEEHCFRSEMILDFADAPPQVRKQEVLTDPSAVDRILVNLVDNACKYGKTDESQVIELSVNQQDRWLVFEVADNGPGLAKAQRRRLFKAYNHGQIGAKSPNTTIGLGLNICFNLAKALGGSLSFEDNNPGCRFILKIPLDVRSR